MKGTFVRTTLGAIAEFVNGGAWSPDEYCDHGVPVVRVTDIHDETVDLSECKFLQQDALPKYERHRLLTGDLVICTVGSHPTQLGSVVGRAAIVPPSSHGALLNQNAVRIRPTSSQVDRTWLGYLGRSPGFHDYILSCARGSANQVRMAIGLLKEMPVELPPISVQRRIADTLSAYDELLDNNLRRIRILEEMARALYHEWFIECRFPGNRRGALATKDQGPLLDGWRLHKLEEVAVVNQAQINTRQPPKHILYIDIASVGSGTVRELTPVVFENAPGRARRIVQHGDILWSCVRPNRRSHVLMLNPEPETVASTGFAVLTATKVPYTFLYQATTTDKFVSYLTNHATGAAYPAVTGRTFQDAEILLPPEPLLNQFAELTVPQAELIAVLQRQNVNLRQTRDLLILRLLSGQLSLAG